MSHDRQEILREDGVSKWSEGKVSVAESDGFYSLSEIRQSQQQTLTGGVERVEVGGG
jgi:hypothetical protein